MRNILHAQTIPDGSPQMFHFLESFRRSLLLEARFSAWNTVWRSGSAPPDPIAAIKGPTSKGKGERRKGVGEGRRGRKKRGGERTGEEREGEDTPMGPQLKTPSAAYGCNYRAMHFSAKHCLAIACHPSVRLSVTLYVGGLWTKAAISLKRVKIEERLLWTACRKWNHQRSFEWYHRRTSTASSSPKFGVRNPNQNCNLKLRANECW